MAYTAPLVFETQWRDRGVAEGLKRLGSHAAETKTKLDRLNTSGGGLLKGFAASAAAASRAGAGIGVSLQHGLRSPAVMKAAHNTGLRMGQAIGGAISKSAVGQMARAGHEVGRKLFEGASARLKSSPWGRTMLRLPSLLSAASSAGQRFGSRLLSAAGKVLSSGVKAPTVKGGKGLGALGAGLGGLKGGIVGLAATLTGGAIFTGLKGMATAASDLNETISKGRNIFGSSAKAIESWARTAARNLGLSRQEALDGAAAFGNLFDQLGFGVKQSTAMSKGFVQMASDAASFNNANPAEVMDAFLSATRGEYDALQRYIPTVNAASIETYALSSGIVKASKNTSDIQIAQQRASIAQQNYTAAVKAHGLKSIEAQRASVSLASAQRAVGKAAAGNVPELTAAQKAQALYGISTRDLGKAHGDFARTAEGFANQQRIMAANWADLRVKIGQYFLPMFTKAAVYMNTEGFPALTRIVTALGDVGKSAGRMGRAVLSVFSTTFAGAIDGATINLTEIADWMETHQASMVKFFIRLGDGAIAFGRGVVTLATNAVRGFGDMAGAMSETVRSVGNGIASLMEGAAKLLPPWSDARRDLLKGAADIRTGANTAADGLAKTKTRANEAADAIARKATPAFDKAREALHRVGNEEIWKAKQRDAAARASIAIRDIGVRADGSQIKLRSWNERTRLGSVEQRRLEGRIRDARRAMLEQREAGIRAGDSQATLTKRWDKGKDALYREFRQMKLSKEEARRLADAYGKIPGKVKTKVTWDTAVDDINTKLTFRYGKAARLISAAKGTVLPGFTPGHDVHRFVSRSGDQLDLSGGEAVMVPEWTRAVGGPKEVARMNAAARRRQAFASGGVFRLMHAGGTRAVREGGTDAVSALLKRLGPDFGGVGPIGSPAHVSNPRGIGHYGGGTFTRLFIAGLKQVAKAVGHSVHVTQGGFRPTTSYSGSTHNKDAIDTRVEMGVLRAFRKYVGAMGDRTGLGNWGAHMHGVPAPGRGYGSASARSQYQDYLRRGGARQSPRSPWGLERGGLLTAQVAEKGPERLLTNRQTNAYDRLVRVAETRGIGNTTIVINAPHWIGSRNEVRDMLVQMVKSGHFKVLTR